MDWFIKTKLAPFGRAVELLSCWAVEPLRLPAYQLRATNHYCRLIVSNLLIKLTKKWDFLYYGLFTSPSILIKLYKAVVVWHGLWYKIYLIRKPINVRALHNPHFCSILVIARSPPQADGLSTCFEIASSAKGLWRTRNDNAGVFQRSQCER